MSAIIHVTGPGHLWVAPGPSRVPVYFGDSQAGFKIIRRPGTTPVISDSGGRKVPVDILSDGDEYFVSGEVNLFDPTVYNIIETPPLQAGTLMRAEGFMYEVWLQFPYAIKPFYASNGLVPGYHFLSGYSLGPTEQPTGTEVRTPHMMFHFIPSFASNGARVSVNADFSKISGLKLPF